MSITLTTSNTPDLETLKKWDRLHQIHPWTPRSTTGPTRRLTPTTTRDAIGSNGDKETVRGVQDRATAREAVRGIHFNTFHIYGCKLCS